jgi:hypothetical protein
MAKQPEPSAKDKPRKFEHIYKDADGSESIWKYDLDKFPNGPISVEQRYSAEYLKNEKERLKLAAAEKKYGKLAEMHLALDKVKETRVKKQSKTPPKTPPNTPKSEFNPKEKVTISNEPKTPKTTLKKDKNNPKNFW